MTDVADLLARVRQAEHAIAELRRATIGGQREWNLRDARDVDQRMAGRTTNPVLVYDRLTGTWPVRSAMVVDPVSGLFHGGFRAEGALLANVETALGVDRLDLGVLYGTPRLVFENATFGLYEIDLDDTGALRFYVPGSIKMTLTQAGILTVGSAGAGSVRSRIFESADGTGPRVLATGAANVGSLDFANRGDITNVVARILGMAGQANDVLRIFHDGTNLGVYVNQLGALGANSGVIAQNPVNNDVSFGHLHASGSRTDSCRLWLDVPAAQTLPIARFSKAGVVKSYIDHDGTYVGPVDAPALTCTVKATATQTLSVGQENTDVAVAFDTQVENPTERSVSDGVSVFGDPTVTSATANFTARDVGSVIRDTTFGTQVVGYIGAINSPTSIELSSSPTSNVPVGAAGSHTGLGLKISRLWFDDANNEIEVLVAGIFICEVEVPFHSGATMDGVRCGHLRKNPRGTSVTISHLHATPGAQQANGYSTEACTVPPHHGGFRLAVGDRVGCTALKRTNFGAPLSVDLTDGYAAAYHRPRMTVTRIGS